MNPQQRRLMLRRILKKKYGTNASGGGGGDFLTLPYTFDFDAETTDATPSWVTNNGTDTAVVKEEAVEGHSKHLWLPGTNGAQVACDLGTGVDATKGIRLQALVKCGGPAYGNYAAWFVEVASGSAQQVAYARWYEHATAAQFRSIWKKDGVGGDTGNVNKGQVNSTAGDWQYLRIEFDSTDETIFDNYNIVGVQEDQYPVTLTNHVSAVCPTEALRYLWFQSENFYETRIAEVWIGDLTDPWPTAGEPQS